MPRDTKLPASSCPCCGYELTGAFSLDGYSPTPGDFCVCLKCASPLVFEDDMHLQPLTADEFASLDSDVQKSLQKHQRIIRAIGRT